MSFKDGEENQRRQTRRYSLTSATQILWKKKKNTANSANKQTSKRLLVSQSQTARISKDLYNQIQTSRISSRNFPSCFGNVAVVSFVSFVSFTAKKKSRWNSETIPKRRWMRFNLSWWLQCANPWRQHSNRRIACVDFCRKSNALPKSRPRKNSHFSFFAGIIHIGTHAS